MRFQNLFLLFILLLVAFTSCDRTGEELEQIKTNVAQIRQAFRNCDVGRIHDSASNALRSSISSTEFVASLEPFCVELGKIDNFELISSGTGWNAKDGRVTFVRYQNRAPQKVEQDEFIYQYDEGDWKLYSYTIMPK